MLHFALEPKALNETTAAKIIHLVQQYCTANKLPQPSSPPDFCSEEGIRGCLVSWEDGLIVRLSPEELRTGVLRDIHAAVPESDKPFNLQDGQFQQTIATEDGELRVYIPNNRQINDDALVDYNGASNQKVRMTDAVARNMLEPFVRGTPIVTAMKDPRSPGKVVYFSIEASIIDDLVYDSATDSYIAGAERTDLKSVVACPVTITELENDGGVFKAGGFSRCVTITPQTDTIAIYDPRHSRVTEDFAEFELTATREKCEGLAPAIGLIIGAAFKAHIGSK